MQRAEFRRLWAGVRWLRWLCSFSNFGSSRSTFRARLGK